MSKHRVMVKKLYCLISAVVILTCSISVFAMVPLDAEVTVDNIMEYANEYDPDGAFILQKAIDSRDKILRWYSEDQSILEGYDTAVHEECHHFTTSLFWTDLQYYIGDGESIKVKEGKVYDTVKMAREIPEELRTFRYDDYIGEKALKDMTSRKQGAYGLLDEYIAYSWGMNAVVKMYAYLDDADADPDIWKDSYLESGYSNMIAQAEFDFWILRYLIYAKENEPSVYKATLKNKDFIRAYLISRERYQRQVLEYRQSLPDVADLLVDKGYDVAINGNYFYIRSDDGLKYAPKLVDEQQEMLEEEIKKPEYQEMLQELESADEGTYEPDEKDAAAEEDAASDSDQTDEDKTPADDDHPDGILQQIWSFIKALPDIVIGFFKSASELIKPVIDFFKSLWSTVTDVFS